MYEFLSDQEDFLFWVRFRTSRDLTREVMQELEEERAQREAFC